MSLIKISELPQTETVNQSDTLPIVNNTATKKVSVEQLKDAIGGLDYQIINDLTQVTRANVLYLIPLSTSGDNNIYNEYMYINGNAELIGLSPTIVLTKNNTTAYTPTGDYNPSTKKYVDDSIKTAIGTALEGSY